MFNTPTFYNTGIRPIYFIKELFKSYDHRLYERLGNFSKENSNKKIQIY